MHHIFTVTKQDNQYIGESNKYRFKGDTKERLLAVMRAELGDYACHRRKNKWIINENIPRRSMSQANSEE